MSSAPLSFFKPAHGPMGRPSCYLALATAISLRALWTRPASLEPDLLGAYGARHDGPAALEQVVLHGLQEPHAALERALAFLSDRVVHALLELVVCHPSLVGHLTGLATRGRLAKMNPCFFGPGAGGQTRVHTMTAGVFSISFSGLRAAGTLLLSSSSSFTLISQNL